jgi:tetratricopeptide (TPR) repeat protein
MKNDDDLLRGFNKNFNAPLNERHLISTEKNLKKDKSYKTLSDYAVRLTKVGKFKESLEILKELGKKYPNEYQIISNLGTSYELNGELDSPLKYIRKGLKLNPLSHDKSEWVHERILITKLELTENPNYLDSNTILNISEKDTNYHLLAHQVSIQLRERFPYCPPSNIIMQNLLIELGDIYVNSNSVLFGICLYRISRDYYLMPSTVINTKVIAAKKHITRTAKKVNAIDQRLGMSSSHKYGGMNHKKRLDNNNKTNYLVNWDKVNTDVDELLAIVGLKRLFILCESFKRNITRAHVPDDMRASYN